MAITPMHPYLPQYRPLSNITPFTYRDGLTYVKTLEALREYVRTLTEHVNKTFETLDTEVSVEIDALIDSVNSKLSEQSQSVDAEIQTLITFVNNKVQEMIEVGVTTSDPVMATIFNDNSSETRIVADDLYVKNQDYSELVEGRLSDEEISTKIELATQPVLSTARALANPTTIPGIRSLEKWVGFFGNPGHGWAVAPGATGTVDLGATDQKLVGNYSVSVAGMSGTSGVQKTTLAPVSIKGKNVRIPFRYTGNVTGILVYFSSDASLGSRVQRQIMSAGAHGPDIDHVVDMPAGAFAVTAGSPDVESIIMCRIIVNFGPAGGKAWIGGVGITEALPSPLITLSFDDSASDHYTKARVAMNMHGMVGTAYPTVSSIGNSSDNITLTQLRHLHDVEGWEIGMHAITSEHHTDHGDKSETWLREHFERLLEWNTKNGFSGSTFAWPNTNNSAFSRQIAGEYFATARGGVDAPDTIPSTVRMATKAINCGPLSVADIKSRIDLATSDRGYGHLNLFFHRLPEVKVDSNDFSASNFIEVVDYIASTNARVVTAADAARVTY